MGLVIVGALLIACVLLYQAICTFRTGRLILFPVKFAHPGANSRILHRACLALIYLFPAMAIIAILTTALSKWGVLGIQTWAMRNFSMLFWSLCLSLIGMLLVTQPEKMLRWTIRDNPDIAHNKSAVVITRFIGIGLVGLGLTIIRML